MYKVLLVDDEFMIIKGLQKLINWEELNLELVGSCKDGQEAYEFVKNNHVDIVVTDVNMPFMSGIDFVRKTQEDNLNFYVILLSGYQEFEYVKEGIQLGVENFLVKPIDKAILHKTLESTVAKLEKEENQKESDKIVLDNTLLKWINDEIEITDLRRALKLTGHQLKANTKYSIFIFENKLDELKNLFAAHQQNLYFTYQDDLVLIFQGEITEFQNFRNDLSHKYHVQDKLKGLGELFVEVDEVYKSYEQASQSLEFLNFYKGQAISKIFDQNKSLNSQTANIYNLSFSKFHQALAVRDESLIFMELRNIFNTLKEKHTDSNYICYLSFIIISDIYREFGITDAEVMNDSVQRVYKAATIDGVETNLYRVYHDVSEESKDISYSDLVRDVLFIIMQRYSDDLTLLAIADELHVNSMYLGQLFKKELGVSFSKYLNSYRVKKAQDLIINTSLNFSEISEQVGYSSPGYFYKKFKKECGFSPSDYREKYRK